MPSGTAPAVRDGRQRPSQRGSVWESVFTLTVPITLGQAMSSPPFRAGGPGLSLICDKGGRRWNEERSGELPLRSFRGETTALPETPQQVKKERKGPGPSCQPA